MPGEPVLIRLGEAGDIFRGADFVDGHPDEFLARVTVLIYGGFIHRQKGTRVRIENPHRVRVLFKQKPVLLLTCGEFDCPFPDPHFEFRLRLDQLRLSLLQF